jgi:hypothetical protein
LAFLADVPCRDFGAIVNSADRAEARRLLYAVHRLFPKGKSMVAPVAAYVVAFGAMLFAGLSALTLITVVKHLDPPEHAAEPPVRIPEKIAV